MFSHIMVLFLTPMHKLVHNDEMKHAIYQSEANMIFPSLLSCRVPGGGTVVRGQGQGERDLDTLGGDQE